MSNRRALRPTSQSRQPHEIFQQLNEQKQIVPSIQQLEPIDIPPAFNLTMSTIPSDSSIQSMTSNSFIGAPIDFIPNVPMVRKPPTLEQVETKADPFTLVRNPVPRRFQTVAPNTVGTLNQGVPNFQSIPTNLTSRDQVGLGGSYKLNISSEEKKMKKEEEAESRSNLPVAEIMGSELSLLSFEEMEKLAGGVEVKLDRIIDAEIGSVNDPRLGPDFANEQCIGCGRINCAGHYGLIRFKRPIYNPLTIRETMSVLSCVCNCCGKPLLSRESMEESGLLSLTPTDLLSSKGLEAECKRGIKCQFADRLAAQHGVTPCRPNPKYIPSLIKKEGKIMYNLSKEDKIEIKTLENAVMFLDRLSDLKMINKVGDLQYIIDNRPHYIASLEYALNGPIAQLVAKDVIKRVGQSRSYRIVRDEKAIIRSAEEAYRILDMISKEDSHLLGFRGDSHPRNFILQGMLVIPPIERPRNMEMGRLQQNELTKGYLEIIAANNKIQPGSIDDESVSYLYRKVKEFLRGSDNQHLRSRGKAKRSIKDLIQGKKAIVRANMMGKRVKKCGRTVLGPDPRLKFGEIGVPSRWAPYLTVTVIVTKENIEAMRELLSVGHVSYIFDTIGNRRQVVKGKKYTIDIGYKIERWLRDGDYVVFGRQPTLSKHSMLGYKAVLLPGNTIRLHLAACTPHNADFDGDEGTIHVPGSEKASQEVKERFNIRRCILQSQQSRPVIGLTNDVVVGLSLLSQPGLLLDREHIVGMASEFIATGDPKSDRDPFANLSMLLMDFADPGSTFWARLDKYNVNSRSGRAVISALFPEDFDYNHDGVTIREGILIGGQLTSKHVGPKSQSIVQELVLEYDNETASDFITNASFLAGYYMTVRGLSISASDCFTDDQKIRDLVRREVIQMEDMMESFTSKDEVQKEIEENTILRQAQDIQIRTRKQISNILEGKDNPLLDKVKGIFESRDFKSGLDFRGLIIDSIRFTPESKLEMDSIIKDTKLSGDSKSQKLALFVVNKLNFLIRNAQTNRDDYKTYSDQFAIEIKTVLESFESRLDRYQAMFNFMEQFTHEKIASNIISQINNVIADNASTSEKIAVITELVKGNIARIKLKFTLIQDKVVEVREVLTAAYANEQQFINELPRRLASIWDVKQSEFESLIPDIKKILVDPVTGGTRELQAQAIVRLVDDDLSKRHIEHTWGREQFIDNITRWIDLDTYTGTQEQKVMKATNKILNLWIANEIPVDSKISNIIKKNISNITESKDDTLDRVNSIIATYHKAKLAHERNALIVMSEAGSKGDLSTLTQTLGQLGQLYYSNKRPVPTLPGNRCLPMFEPDDRDPRSRGFVCNNYGEGIGPAGYYFTNLTGREGLIDTAIKTSETGDLSHRIAKTLEDIIIFVDGSIRNSSAQIFTFVPGGDGYEGSRLKLVNSKLTGSVRAPLDIGVLISKLNRKAGWKQSSE